MKPLSKEHELWIAKSSAVVTLKVDRYDSAKNPASIPKGQKYLILVNPYEERYYAPEHVCSAYYHGLSSYKKDGKKYILGSGKIEIDEMAYETIEMRIDYTYSAHQTRNRKIRIEGGDFTPQELEEKMKRVIHSAHIDCSCGLTDVSHCPINLLEPDGY